MLFDFGSTALVTLLVTLDPAGLVPIFISVTRGMNSAERRQVALRASLLAFGILAFFGVGGDMLLDLLGVGLPAFRISGGLLLFWIAFEMVFERRTDRKQNTVDVAITEDHIRNVAAFPLAIPLMAGPGAITATILLAGRTYERPLYLISLILLIGVGVAACFALFLAADRVARFLGTTGNVVMSRLLGLILAGLAVQFVVDGVLELVPASG